MVSTDSKYEVSVGKNRSLGCMLQVLRPAIFPGCLIVGVISLS